MKTKGFISIWNHHKCISQPFPIHLNTYVIGLRPLEMFLFFQCRDPVYTSEYAVYRRQILTYKDGLRTERVKSWRPLSRIRSWKTLVQCCTNAVRRSPSIETAVCFFLFVTSTRHDGHRAWWLTGSHRFWEDDHCASVTMIIQRIFSSWPHMYIMCLSDGP